VSRPSLLSATIDASPRGSEPEGTRWAEVAVWIVFAVTGLVVELAAIVLLGRSVTRRDEETGADILGAAARSLRNGGHEQISVELPRTLTGNLRLIWPGRTRPAALGLVPKPRRGD
jgi:hypothetical protein